MDRSGGRGPRLGIDAGTKVRVASTWLKGASGSTEGLTMPGRPSRSAATLLLAPASVLLAFGGITASLHWDHFGTHWSLGGWRAGEYVDLGVALRASGPAADAVVPVYDAIRKHHNRLVYLLDLAESAGERVVPLFAARVAHLRLDKESETLTVLCRLLAHEMTLRDRLTDVPRVERLLADRRSGSLGVVAEKLHVRRGRVEVRTAMHALRLVHTYDGRPIPGRGAAGSVRGENLAELAKAAAPDPPHAELD
jgi:hypothetical protein